MKNLIYTNRINVDYKTLYARAKDYFHRHGVELDFTFVQTDYKNLTYRIANLPQGQRVILQPTMSQVVPLDPTYDFVSFLFNGREFIPPNIPTGYCYGTGKQPFMDILTDELNPKDLDYVTICHELMHALTMKANLAGYITADQMDSYYHAMDLESADSNFGRQWALLKPYIDSLKTTLPQVTITRTHPTAKEILGELRLSDDSFGCNSLELPWLNNQQNVSAIPVGKYVCKWKFMLSQLAYHYELQNVPNRGGVFIHAGNYFFDSKGCILLGSAPLDINGDKELDVRNSKVILSAFEKRMNKQDFILEIK